MAGGALILRNEDLDTARCRPEFAEAMLEDLHWFGFRWSEGPYRQSNRLPYYLTVMEHLAAGGFVYPCRCSRREVLQALTAPHAGEEEPVYPGTCRPRGPLPPTPLAGVNWRFRVPDGEAIAFQDSRLGRQQQIAGRDFGDFLVWRKDGFPSYQLAVVSDDAAMGITEVVRGEDLVTSTFRQLVLYRALALEAPAFHHCALLTDEHGVRLAKRHDALSLRTLRERGATPEELRAGW